jgi:hypothetical protein
MKKAMLKSFIPLFLAFMAYGILLYISGNDTICFFKIYTGLPCPGCGMTRAFIAVSRGYYQESFYWHPLWIWAIIGPLLYAIIPYCSNKAEWHRKWLVRITLIACLLVYFIRMLLLFPHTAPMDFNDRAIVLLIFKVIVAN